MTAKPWVILIGIILIAIILAAINQGITDRRWRQFMAERDSLRAVAVEYDQRRLEAASENARLRAQARALDSESRQLAAKADSANRTSAALRARLAATRATVDTVTLIQTQDSLITSLTAETVSLRSALAKQVEASAALGALVASLQDTRTLDSTEISGLRRLVSRAPAPRSGKLFGILPTPKCGPGVAFGTDLAIRPALACLVPF